MSSHAWSNVAAFLQDSYEVPAILTKEEAALAGTHEEVHGIIRRSSFYGLLLNRALAQTPGGSAGGWVHWISSRARTSEEVAATFISVTTAEWSGPITAAAGARSLKAHPEYDYYHQIGTLLTSNISVPFFKNAVVEGLIRFCWCSSHIRDFCEANKEWQDLLRLPPLAFPDNRLQHLKQNWIGKSSQKLNSDLKGEFSALIKLLQKKTFSQIFDPLYEIKRKFGNFLFADAADSGVILAEVQHKVLMAMALKTEEIVGFVMNHLSSTFRGTELATPNYQEIWDFLRRDSKPQKTITDLGKEVAVFEVVINRPKRLRVRVVQKLDDSGLSKKPVVGIRSWESFQSNFDVSDLISVGGEKGSCAFYGIHAPRPDVQDYSGCDITLISGTPSQALSSLERLLTPPALVAIWASLFLTNTAEWINAITALASQDSHVWIIGDVEPGRLLEIVNLLLVEVNALFYRSLKDRPNFGTLIVRGLEGPHLSGPVRGIIFAGQGHTAEAIVRLMQRNMGDNFRGFGPGPELSEEGIIRRREGELISAWLMFSEERFAYK